MLNFLKKMNIIGNERRDACNPVEIINQEETCELVQKDNIELLDKIDFTKYDDIIYDKESTKPKILIVDDIEMTRKLYEFDFSTIAARENPHNIKEDFNVIYSTGAKCGYESLKLISYVDKIDYAILDLTLGYIERLPCGAIVDIDGVDLAIKILEKNPSAKIVFSTAHTMDFGNSAIREYMGKLLKYTGIKLTEESEMYVNKNSDRVERLLKLLYNE